MIAWPSINETVIVTNSLGQWLYPVEKKKYPEKCYLSIIYNFKK
jgi:hypothetical protein